MTREYKGFFMGMPVITDTSLKKGEWKLSTKGGIEVIRSNPPKV
jgi:hypothetical protein